MKLAKIIAAGTLAITTQTMAFDGAIVIGSKRFSSGDNINGIYREWGRPDISATTERTCKRIIERKRTYCSRSRKIWDKGGTYWMVQHSGSLIIKVTFTRFKSDFTKEF